MPRNHQIWPEFGISDHCWLIRCPVDGLAGGCGARAVSRKTPIYFIYFISFTDKVYSKQARWHWLISSILTQCSFRSNRGSWQPWCTLLALPYRRLRVRRRRCRRPSSCSRSSDTTGGLHCHRHMRQPGNIAKNDTGKEAKFFSWLCKDLLHKSLQEIPCHPQHTFGSL